MQKENLAPVNKNKPIIILRAVGITLLLASLIWLFSGFMVYITIKATNVQSEVNNARLGVAVSVCTILFILFSGSGMAIMSRMSWAWQQVRAAALAWLMLGVYLTAAWGYFSPQVNQTLLQENHLSREVLETGRYVVMAFMSMVCIVLPIIVISSLSLMSVKQYFCFYPYPSDKRPLNEMFMLWGLWGFTFMMLLGLVFDDRLTQWTQNQSVNMRFFWLWASVIVGIAAVCVQTRKIGLLIVAEILALLTLLIAISAWLMSSEELSSGWLSLPQDKMHRDIAISAFMYFGAVGFVGTNVLIFQKWKGCQASPEA